MRHAFLPLALLLTFATLPFVRAADDPRAGALAAADEARVAAFVAGDPARLQEILSDDLRYAHSSGAVDTKASLIEAMRAGRLKYTGLIYQERSFTFPAPGIALMSGRVKLQVTTANGPIEIPAGFLAVWREEAGHWHFLAWQSARLPDAAK